MPAGSSAAPPGASPLGDVPAFTGSTGLANSSVGVPGSELPCPITGWPA
jgi:hypothetical protein